MSYILTKMTDIIEFNPRESIAKKQVCKKVPMEYLQPFTRQISGYEEAPYAGGTKFRNNDTIMARITPCLENGKTAFVKGFAENEVVFGSTEYIVMRAIPGHTDPAFIYYLATSPSFREVAIKSMVGSSGRQRVQQDVFENLELVLPDYETQVRAGKVLSAFDDKIELNTRINHNLEEQAKALYDQIWNNYDSGTWSFAKAEDLFDISIGKTPPRKESQWFSENENDIVWVSIADMGQSGCFISNSSEYLIPDAVSKFNVKRVPAGAILLSFKLTVGRVAITGCELTTNEAIAHFRIEDSTIREYLYFYLKHFNYQTMGSTSSIATAVNSKMVKAMRIDIPARETLENFHSTVFPMFEQIKQNQQEIQTLAQLRDALLPKLMSGEIDVSEVEI
jgi:type I restriction enzyme S subunit